MELNIGSVDVAYALREYDGKKHYPNTTVAFSESVQSCA